LNNGDVLVKLPSSEKKHIQHHVWEEESKSQLPGVANLHGFCSSRATDGECYILYAKVGSRIGGAGID